MTKRGKRRKIRERRHSRSDREKTIRKEVGK